MGTKLNLKDPNPGFWVHFEEDNDDSGKIAIRPVNSAKVEEIRKKAVKKRVEYKHGNRFEVQDVNDELYSELLWDYSIADWSGLVDDDGNTIECTKENKIFLMKNHVGFARFVTDQMNQISEQYESRLTLVNENLLQGSSGSGTRKSQAAKTAEK